MHAAGLAAKQGYSRVYTFIGGIPEWRRFNYPMTVDPEYQRIPVTRLEPRRVQELLRDPAYFLLDVRPKDFQRDASFIAGARHCPLVHLGERYPALPADRTLIISDWAMKQSPAAAKFLTRKGYKVAGVLRGGMERWQAERLPVEQRTPGPGLDLPETADRD